MDNLPALLQAVESRCPKLTPVFFPNGVSEKQVLSKRKLAKKPKCCQICGSEEEELVPQVLLKYDLPQRKASVDSVKFVCPLCKSALDVSRMMEVMVNSNNNEEEADTLIRHFLLVNRHSPEDTRLMEEILSSCYSLKIVLKSYLSPALLCSVC